MSYSVLGYCGFTCRCMCADQYILVWFYRSDWFDLEGVEWERVDFGFELSFVYLPVIILREVDLMNASLLCSNGFNFDILQSFAWNFFITLLILLSLDELLWSITLILVDDFSRTLLFDRLGSRPLDGLLKNGERIICVHCWEYY